MLNPQQIKLTDLVNFSKERKISESGIELEYNKGEVQFPVLEEVKNKDKINLKKRTRKGSGGSFRIYAPSKTHDLGGKL